MHLLCASLILASSLVPLPELGTAPYRWGYLGGLWDNGSNVGPAVHLAAGLRHAAMIQPLDTEGRPSADGKIGFLAVGYGNPALTFEQFRDLAFADPHVNRNALVLVNAAGPHLDGKHWERSWDPNYASIINSVLPSAKVTEQQIQVAWIQMINEHPYTPLGVAFGDAYLVKGVISDTLRNLKSYYPNLRVAYLSGPEYGGYDATRTLEEPFAYEASLSVRWVAVGQADLMRVGDHWDGRLGDLNYEKGSVPWVTWGPYLWADGTTPRADGLTWQRDDFLADGFTLSAKGARKSATELLKFLLREPTAAGWFRISNPSARPRPVRH